MCTIWTDHYNRARKVARYYVFCGLSDRKDIYGMFHCWSEMERYYVSSIVLDIYVYLLLIQNVLGFSIQ